MSRRRDDNVRRMILTGLRDGATPTPLKEIEAADAELVTHNSALLVEGKFVEGQVLLDGSGNYSSVVMLRLSNKGHDLLEALEAQQLANTSPMQTTTNASLSIFISHSSKDKELAAAFTELLRSAFSLPAPQIRCSSVDGYRLPVGASTEEQLRQEVHDAKVFIGLITPSSVQSAFVMFELGARWGAKLQLAPVLGAGADASYLRGPLSSLSALNCAEPAQVHQLLDDLAKPLGITNRTPASAYQVYVEKLVATSKRLAGPSHLSKALAAAAKLATPSPGQHEDLAAEARLDPEETKILQVLARYDEQDGVALDQIARECGLQRIEARHFTAKLEEHLLIEQMSRFGEATGIFRLTEEGREHVVKERLH